MGRPKGSTNKNKATLNIAFSLKDLHKREILFNRLLLIVWKTKKELGMDDIEISKSVKQLYNEVKRLRYDECKRINNRT